ncbi:hypothetical protein FKX85_05000 [Echinicola soli]|uniref:Uncharacterized protein n=1 Tax=Echinicola soli TaxID=2591634 RepID=A0A514CF25_9BACT|nr:hypothetical protein [Echinicola soli]QDH78423.1 hypothetical protein FKX85_05000 [Echinicola soli]
MQNKPPNTDQTMPHYTMPMRGVILISGMMAVAWGAFFRWMGDPLLSWLAMTPGQTVPADATIYGSFVLIIGFLLFLSAFYPISWIYLTMLGIAGKLISAIWFVAYYVDILGWNKRTIFHLGFNELFWLIPLSYVLWKALQVKVYLQTYEE